ncbi:MAG: hypothetical protein FWH36_00765 [Lentimicrobiaceae bacterium]|nr:hypothetical protein [Lentimicrobiaceae bacterium]
MNLKRCVLILCLSLYNAFALHAQIYIHDVVQDSSAINKIDEHGRPQGLWYFYSKSTGIVSEKYDFFISGLIHGSHEFYSDLGILIKQEYYKYGILDSLWREYWNHGELHIEAYFENGIPNGEIKIYSDSLEASIIHQYGKINFSQSYFNKNYKIDTSSEGLRRVWYYWPQYLDTLKTYFPSKYNKEYFIYYNHNLYKSLVFYKNKLCIEDFYVQEINIKRIVYYTKKPYGIKKIFYYTKDGELFHKTEYYNKKGVLVKTIFGGVPKQLK